jgi:hypothetical protein
MDSSIALFSAWRYSHGSMVGVKHFCLTLLVISLSVPAMWHLSFQCPERRRQADSSGFFIFTSANAAIAALALLAQNKKGHPLLVTFWKDRGWPLFAKLRAEARAPTRTTTRVSQIFQGKVTSEDQSTSNSQSRQGAQRQSRSEVS